MKIWNVVLEGIGTGDLSELALEFVDLKEIIGKYIGVSFQILDHLKKIASSNVKYRLMTHIKSVTDPNSGKKSQGTFLAILGLDINDKDYGFLFMLTPKGLGLMAMWPEGLVNELKNQENKIKALIALFIQYPDYWKSVNIVLPKQSSD